MNGYLKFEKLTAGWLNPYYTKSIHVDPFEEMLVHHEDDVYPFEIFEVDGKDFYDVDE